MEFDIYKINKYIVSSDTDSLFVNIGKILKHTHPNLNINNVDECLPIVRKYQKEIGKELNDYQSILAKKLLNSNEHYFDLKPEFIIKKAYWSGKRRYAQYIIDQEGIPKNDVIMMGLDIMKSNFPPYFKTFGEELIKKILFDNTKEDIDKFVMEFKDSIQNINWNKLLKPTGLKKIDEYIKSKPQQDEIFSKLKLKCPINTKAAIITNDILRYKNIQNQYHEFNIGDKMYVAYLKPNPLGIKVIGLNGYNDAPYILELVNKYIDRDGLFDSIMRNKLENLYNDIKWNLSLNPYENSLESFEI